MKSTVQKWGNSLAVRIPLALALQCQLKKGSAIDIAVEDKKIIIRMVKKKMALSKLLAAMTADNLHGSVDTGDFVGRENIDE